MFVRKKTLKKNNDILFKRNTQLNEFCIILQNKIKEQEKEIERLNRVNKDINDELIITSEIYEEKKKECKRLKTILTKNKIEYRKEN